jgi:DtxR family manganese transport transcriptional regulator
MPAQTPSDIVTSPTAEQMQLRAFARQRDRRQAMIAEDYCELIADLITEHGEARAVDVARRLGVSHATVVNTVARLQRDGYASSQPYRSIFLTPLGQRIAVESKRRHETVTRFLQALGVDAETARADAEGIEHHVSDATLAAFERFIAAQA